MRTRVRAISYFLSIVAIAAIFFSVEHFTERFFFHDDDVVDIGAAIVVAVSFSECRRFFDRATDRIFFRAPRDARTELFTDLSHELQTPIAILRGNVELLQRRSLTDAERVSAERVIVTTLDGMSRLIGGVLDGAKLRYSGKVFKGDEIEVQELVRETYEDCFLLAEDKGVFLSCVADANADAGHVSQKFYIKGDRDKLKEVLLNLISNALKHTRPGGTVVLRAEPRGAKVRIVVEDSGCGIAPQDLPHIFERFYRIEDDPARAPGTGLGLNICRAIVEAHKGSITAESDLGKGSRFVICLPLSPPAAARSSVADDPRAVSAIINS